MNAEHGGKRAKDDDKIGLGDLIRFNNAPDQNSGRRPTPSRRLEPNPNRAFRTRPSSNVGRPRSSPAGRTGAGPHRPRSQGQGQGGDFTLCKLMNICDSQVPAPSEPQPSFSPSPPMPVPAPRSMSPIRHLQSELAAISRSHHQRDKNVRTGEKTAEEIAAMLANDDAERTRRVIDSEKIEFGPPRRRKRPPRRRKDRFDSDLHDSASEEHPSVSVLEAPLEVNRRGKFHVAEDNMDTDETSWRPMFMDKREGEQKAGNSNRGGGDDGWVPKEGPH